jgi:hypothetical protein
VRQYYLRSHESQGFSELFSRTLLQLPDKIITQSDLIHENPYFN